MQELIAQLVRLYLPAGESMLEVLSQHLQGRTTLAFDLCRDGATRAIIIPFEPSADPRQPEPWQRLCDLANALQVELGLPAPAVSVSGASGFRLWLSFEQALPVEAAQRFVDLLAAAYFPGALPTDVSAPVELPPCINQSSGKWAAFIHPGMGASFAEEPALEMQPPVAAQAAFLEGLRSIGGLELRQAMQQLEPAGVVPAAQTGAQSTRSAARTTAGGAGLLLQDATLEDIVAWLHARNIEPTLRHRLPS